MPFVDEALQPARFLPLPPMTYPQFLDWTDEDARAEWVSGRVLHYPPGTSTHQQMKGFVAFLLAQWVEEHDAGTVLTSPFQVYLRHVPSGREPDILFLANSERHRLTTYYCDGPVTLAVEIADDESRTRDREIKYAEYEAEGVREYWVIDDEQQRIDFYVLNAAGRYERQKPNAEGVYHSTVLSGFWINVNWLWQFPKPTLRQILAEWGTP